MFNREYRLKRLENKVAGALGAVNNLIANLEATNDAYDKERAMVEAEIIQAKDHHMDILNAIGQNRKVIENFKNLLK